MKYAYGKFWFLTFVACFAVSVGCDVFAAGKVTIYPAPKGAPVSSAFAVQANGKKLDVYERSGNVHFATCDIDGTVTVTVKPEFAAKHMTVHPRSKGVTAQKENAGWTFEVSEPCNLTLLADGNYNKPVLHLFLNPPLGDPPANAIVYGPGKHVLKGEDGSKTLHLKSGQTLWLAGGAWVDGYVRAKNQKNISVMGRGILDQSESIERGAIRLVNCEKALISGIVVTRAVKGWCTTFKQCRDVVVRKYHVVSVGAHSTDGLNPCNSQNILIEDSFFHTNDDCIAIKGNSGGTVRKKIPLHPNTQPPSENITVRGCVFLSTYNNVICIGAETRAKHFRNIHIQDCDVLYHTKYWRDYGTFSILPLHGTYFSDILFEDIRVEHTHAKLFCFKFGERLYGSGIPGDHSFPGGISNVVIRNVSVDRQMGGIRSEFSGLSNKRIKNVTIENLRYGERYVADKEGMGLKCNEHVSNVRFIVPPDASVIERKIAEPDAAKGLLWLAFSAGMREDAKETDGVVLKIRVRDTGTDSAFRTLFSEQIVRRVWRDYAVDLSKYRGTSIVLEASVEQGGHTQYDWFCLGEPRVVRATEAGKTTLAHLLDSFDKAARGLVADPDKPLVPLEAGARASKHAGDESTQLISGGERKPGIFFHPPWQDGRRAPVAMRWNLELPKN